MDWFPIEWKLSRIPPKMIYDVVIFRVGNGLTAQKFQRRILVDLHFFKYQESSRIKKK